MRQTLMENDYIMFLKGKSARYDSAAWRQYFSCAQNFG